MPLKPTRLAPDAFSDLPGCPHAASSGRPGGSGRSLGLLWLRARALGALAAWCVAAQAGTVHVDQAAAAGGDGRSWSAAYRTIQAGIHAAALAGGGDVWVAAGTYPESITFAAGVQLYGGFSGTETALTERQPRSRPTLIDASRAAAGNRAARTVGIRGVTLARLDGFVIGGSGGGADNAEDNGGLSIVDSTGVTVVDCVFTDNRGSWRGNALNGLRSSFTLERCRIAGNLSNSGATLWLEACVAELQNCLIVGNTAREAVLQCQDSSPTLRHCTVAGNAAASVVHCQQGSSPVLANAIVAQNEGTAVYEEDPESDPELRTCLFHGNTPGANGFYYDYETGALAEPTALKLRLTGARVLEGDPRFADPGLASSWTAAPGYDAATGRTVFTDSSAHWTPGALAWRLLVADVAQGERYQLLIVHNTETTIEVAFDQHLLATSGAPYRVLDYHLQDGSAAIDRGADADAALRDEDGEVRLAADAQCDSGADEAPAAVISA